MLIEASSEKALSLGWS